MITTNEEGLKYYDLEKYLFETVSKKYSEEKTLSVFDFFCIIIWKANRAKSKIEDKLKNLGKEKGYKTLKEAVEALIRNITQAKDKGAKLDVLIKDWKFYLPTASAILTVLFPKEFSVYDVRVCHTLKTIRDKDFYKNKPNFKNSSERYFAYIDEVRNTVPESQELRDQDRSLWGIDFAEQLKKNVEHGFKDQKTKPKTKASSKTHRRSS
jgi:hypothetical protein